MNTPNILLIGFMGTGKTTVSRQLSRRLGRNEIDTDQLIAQQEGSSIPEIFEQHGEAYFRELESALLIGLREKHGLIVSCGGGMALREENAAYMKQAGIVVLLTASPHTIFSRVRHSQSRPLLNGHMNIEYIQELLNQRQERYLAAADLVVKTDHKRVAEICQEIIDRTSRFSRTASPASEAEA